MAQTLRIEVRHWSSTFTARPFMSRPRLSRFQPSLRGLRPTATSTWSAAISRSSPAPSRTRTPFSLGPSRLCPRYRLDAQFAQGLGYRLGQFLVVARQDARLRFHHRYLDAELAVGGTQPRPM